MESLGQCRFLAGKRLSSRMSQSTQSRHSQIAIRPLSRLTFMTRPDPYCCFRRGARKAPDALPYVFRRIPVDPVEKDIHVEGDAFAGRFAELFCPRHQAATQLKRVQLGRFSRAEPVHPFKRVE
jgi:hypothetical protein